MHSSNYQRFLTNQCANCSLFLTNESQKMMNINQSSDSEDGSKQFEVTNTEAIAYIYGVSLNYLADNLKSHFVKYNVEYQQENILLENAKMSERLKATVLALCEKCAPVFTDLFRISKLFRNLSDKNSLIWKVLEEKGFNSSFEVRDVKCEHDELNDDRLSEDDMNLEHWKVLELEHSDVNSEDDYRNIKTEKEYLDDENMSNDSNSSRSGREEKYCHRPEIETNLSNVDSPGIVMTRAKKRKQDLRQVKLEVSIAVDGNLSADKIAKNCSPGESDNRNSDSRGPNFSDLKPDLKKEKIFSKTKKQRSRKKERPNARTRKRGKVLNIGTRYVKIYSEDGSSKSSTCKYKCNQCEMLCLSLGHFHSHFLRKHFEATYSHEEVIKGPPFPCPKCDSVFKSFMALQFHCANCHDLKVVTARTGKRTSNAPLHCSECDITYDNAKGFLVHQRFKHGQHYLMCTYCKDVFALKSDLDEHRLSKHPQIRKRAPKGSRTKFITDVKDDGEDNGRDLPENIEYCDEPFFCRTCNYKFTTRQALLIHLNKSHSGIFKFDCKDCDETFMTCSLLLKHLTEIHKEFILPKEYADQITCLEPQCGHVYFSHGFQRDHQKTTQHAEYVVACSFCELTFTELDAVKLHQEDVHKSQIDKMRRMKVAEMKSKVKKCRKSFNCKFCDKTYDNFKEMLTHQATHPKEEQWYKCDECQLKFTGFNKFKYHQTMIHSEAGKEFQCEICGRTLNGLRQYRTHCRQHAERAAGIRSVCELCGKSFSTVKMLGKHRRVMHLRKEEKSCKLCGHTSKTSYNMKLHMKVHEKNGILRRRKNTNDSQILPL